MDDATLKMDMLAGLAGAMGGGGGALVCSWRTRLSEWSVAPNLHDRRRDRAVDKQREALERLNVQAHHNAVNHTDEFVKEFLISPSKSMLVTTPRREAWKERVYPHFAKIDPTRWTRG